jgi:hypothetical protein
MIKELKIYEVKSFLCLKLKRAIDEIPVSDKPNRNFLSSKFSLYIRKKYPSNNDQYPPHSRKNTNDMKITVLIAIYIKSPIIS